MVVRGLIARRTTDDLLLLRSDTLVNCKEYHAAASHDLRRSLRRVRSRTPRSLLEDEGADRGAARSTDIACNSTVRINIIVHSPLCAVRSMLSGQR